VRAALYLNWTQCGVSVMVLVHYQMHRSSMLSCVNYVVLRREMVKPNILCDKSTGWEDDENCIVNRSMTVAGSE
jgi:hypothetical protein